MRSDPERYPASRRERNGTSGRSAYAFPPIPPSPQTSRPGWDAQPTGWDTNSFPGVVPDPAGGYTTGGLMPTAGVPTWEQSAPAPPDFPGHAPTGGYDYGAAGDYPVYDTNPTWSGWVPPADPAPPYGAWSPGVGFAPEPVPQPGPSDYSPLGGPPSDPGATWSGWVPAGSPGPAPASPSPMARPPAPASDGSGWPSLPSLPWTDPSASYPDGLQSNTPAPGTGWPHPPSPQGWAPEGPAGATGHDLPAITAGGRSGGPERARYARPDRSATGGRAARRPAPRRRTSALNLLVPDPTQPHSLANTVSGGLVAGLLSWIGITLTVQPALGGVGPAWSAAEVASRFPSLIGWLLAGGIAGLLLHTLSRRSARAGAGGGEAWSDGRAGLLAGQAPGRPATRVVILGGGFGGVSAARHFEKLFPRVADIDVTLVSKSNYLLFTPMLAEVACSSLEASYISVPVRASCPRTRFRCAEVEAVDPERQVVHVRTAGAATAEEIPYDHLVIALGTVPSYLGLPGVQAHSLTLKTLEDATRLRNHVIECLEQADSATDPEVRRRKLTFVVAGAGFSGTEMAAGIFDLIHESLHYFPSLRREDLHVVLVHSRDRILPEIGPELARASLRKLRKRGIDFVLKARVAAATESSVTLDNGAVIATETLVWTAGNRPNPLVAKLPFERTRQGALVVNNKLRVRGYDNVWALGDCAQVPDLSNGGKPCPPTAQHAMRMGKTIARNVAASVLGLPQAAFRFKTLGLLVSLGHRSAAAELRGWKFFGLIAWVMWRGIYLMKLPGAEKRMRVLVDWILDLFFPRDIALMKPGDRAGAEEGVEGDATSSQPTERRHPQQVA